MVMVWGRRRSMGRRLYRRGGSGARKGNIFFKSVSTADSGSEMDPSAGSVGDGVSLHLRSGGGRR